MSNLKSRNSNSHDQDDDLVALLPERRIKPRLAVVVGLYLFGLIGTTAWYEKAFFGLGMAALIGSFPRYRIGRHELQRLFVFMFYPVHVTRWSLKHAEAIETDLEFQLPLWTAIFLGFHWVGVKLIGWLFPWFGGDYKIWFRMYKRERVLAWQGLSEDDFHENLRTLQEMTDLPIERR
jgi:hypothetical protein